MAPQNIDVSGAIDELVIYRIVPCWASWFIATRVTARKVAGRGRRWRRGETSADFQLFVLLTMLGMCAHAGRRRGGGVGRMGRETSVGMNGTTWTQSPTI